jgi:hypothetical protein
MNTYLEQKEEEIFFPGGEYTTATGLIKLDNKWDELIRKCLFVKDGYFIIKTDRHYEIDLDTINTSTDILAWIRHLIGKNWVDNYILKEFLRAAGQKLHLDEWWVRAA